MFPLSSNLTKICLDPVYVDHFLFDSYDKNAQKTGDRSCLSRNELQHLLSFEKKGFFDSDKDN